MVISMLEVFRDPEVFAQIFGALMIFVGLLVNAAQFKRQQVWQSKQFASEQIQQLMSRVEYRNVVRLLAWDGFPADLFPESNDYEKRFVRVSHKRIISVICNDGCDGHCSDLDFRIIDNIDVFLTEVDRYATNVRSGFFPLSETLVSLDYLLKNMSTDRPMDSIFFHIRQYIEKWSYDGILWLIREYEKSIVR